jgi:hypothetical protein
MATDRAGSPPVLACADLRKSFGDRLAVDGVGFTIGPSETYGLLARTAPVLFGIAAVVLALATWRLPAALTH